MENWKNLRTNPPKEDCNICVKIGSSYDTYKFKVYSERNWVQKLLIHVKFLKRHYISILTKSNNRILTT